MFRVQKKEKKKRISTLSFNIGISFKSIQHNEIYILYLPMRKHDSYKNKYIFIVFITSKLFYTTESTPLLKLNTRTLKLVRI